MRYRTTLGGVTWSFASLAEVMAKASPVRSGDILAGLAAGSATENVVTSERVRRHRAAGSSRTQMLRKLSGGLGSPCACSLMGAAPWGR